MKTILLAFSILIASTAMAQSDTLPGRVYNLDNLKIVKDSSRNRIQFLEGSTRDLSVLEIHLTILEPGKAAHPPHTHTDTEELLIVKEGKLQVTVGGKTKLLEAGGVMLALPGDEHGAVNVGDKKAAYYILKYTAKQTMNADRGSKAGGSILTTWKEVPEQKTEKGYRKQFFNRSTALFEKFEMHTTALNKGEISHAPHTHRAEEIIVIIRGNVEMQIRDKFYKAGPGDLVFLSSEVPHALKNTGDKQCEYFAFQW